MTEIGGDFDIDRAMWRANPTELSRGGMRSPMSEDFSMAWYSSGRMALRAMLRGIRKGSFLIPCYVCHAVVSAFEKERFPIEYYAIEPDLGINVRKVVRQSGQSVVGILLMDLFGLMREEVLYEIAGEAEARGLSVIYDTTHGLHDLDNWASIPVDYVFASLRKSLPIPDGAVVFTRRRKLLQPEHEADSYVLDKLECQMQKNDYLRGLCGKEFLEGLRESERGFDGDDEIRRASCASIDCALETDMISVVRLRRGNYEHLLDGLNKSCSIVRPVSLRRPTSSGPIGFPIVSAERDELQKYMASKGVYCPVHWRLPIECFAWAKEHAPFAASLSSNELTLPCDQRYGRQDMDRVLRVLWKYERMC